MGADVVVFAEYSEVAFTRPSTVRINNNVVESVIPLNKTYSFKIRDKIGVNPILTY